MKANLLLLTAGSLIGILLGVLCARLLFSNAAPAPDGGSFDSIAHLRKSMTERDARDIKADRSVSLRSIITPHPSDEIIYTLRPNLDVKFQRVPLKTNSHGMRGPEVKLKKPEGVLRIALLGDSYAFGWGVTQKECFAQVLEDELYSSLNATPKIEVLNFSVPGYSTFQETAAFEEFGVRFEPDIVLVFFVDNDFGLPFYIRNLSKPEKLMPELKFRHKRPKIKDPEKLKRIDSMIEAIDANKALGRLAALTKDKGMALYLAINPKKNWLKEKEKLTVLETEAHIQLLEIREPYIQYIRANNINPKDLSLKRDPHPSPLRHQIIGSVLAKTLAQSMGISAGGLLERREGE